MAGEIENMQDEPARKLDVLPSGLSQRVRNLAEAIRRSLATRSETVSHVHWKRALRAAAIDNPAWLATVPGERLDVLDAIDLALDDLESMEASTPLDASLLEDSVALNPRDVTRLLLSSPRMLGTLLEDIPIAVWIYDVQGRPITMNTGAVEVIGGTAWDAHNIHLRDAGGPHVELFRPDGTPYELDDFPILRAIRGEATIDEEMIIRSRWKSGIYLVNTTPLRDEQGHILATVSTAQDIGRLKRLESELASITNQLKAILDHSAVMILRIDSEGRCDFVNQTWSDFRGRLPAQEQGFGWLEGIHPDDLYESFQKYWDAFAAQESLEWSLRLRRYDGVYRVIAGSVVPYADDREFVGYLATCFDITERIEFQEALRREQVSALAASRTKSRMLRAFSHDLRAPLNAISISTDQLLSHVRDTKHAEVRESEEIIRRSIENVADLLNATLDLSRIESGALPVESKHFVLDDALSECLASVLSEARRKGLRCRFEPPEPPGLMIKADRPKLKQIVSNLLSNAVHYTDQGSVTLRVANQSNQLVIEVDDTGVGIAEADLERVFEEYTRLAGSSRQRRDGSGLGLAIARSLALLLGGTLDVTSTLGEGSTFRLTLPGVVRGNDPE